MKNSFVTNVIAGAIAGLVVSLIVVKQYVPQPAVNEIQQGTSNSEATLKSEYESTVITAVKDASPAVVSIVITKDVPVVEQYFENVPSPFGGFGFPGFNFQVPRLRQNGTQPQEVGGGSGFLVSADGMIVTNKHVVSETDAEYTVFLSDGSKHDATIVARDPVNDIALIKIDGTDFPFLEFGNSDSLQVGQTAIAIGNALAEFDNSVSVGVISGLSRSIQAGDGFGQVEQLERIIQTDAAINPGNSGGPLLDLSGNVIGVNVAVAQGSQNIGFAIPASDVSNIVDSVKKDGKISRPYLGVRYVEVTDSLKEKNNLSVDYGALVLRGTDQDELAVSPGSPADKAGIVENDIILEIDGQNIDSDHTLGSIIRSKKVGQTVTLKVQSKDTQKTVQVTLTEFPNS